MYINIEHWLACFSNLALDYTSFASESADKFSRLKLDAGVFCEWSMLDIWSGLPKVGSVQEQIPLRSPLPVSPQRFWGAIPVCHLHLAYLMLEISHAISPKREMMTLYCFN